MSRPGGGGVSSSTNTSTTTSATSSGVAALDSESCAAEIKQLQDQRKKRELGLVGFGIGDGKGYDSFLYEAEDTDKINLSISTADDEEDPDPLIPKRDKAALPSYTAPSQFFREIPGADAETVVPKRPTIAEREGEYRAQWRKRKMSPPKKDPFTLYLKKDPNEPEPVATAPKKGRQRHDKAEPAPVPPAPARPVEDTRSYKDIMLETILDREKDKVLHEAERIRKQQEAREASAREERIKHDKEEMERRKELRRAGKEDPDDEHNGNRGWFLVITKDGATIAQTYLDPTKVFKFGRDPESDIELAHPSCSKVHAKIKFEPAEGHKIPTPAIVDLGSTNGTQLNGTALVPSEYYPLAHGDSLRFGASTREYSILFR
ncbi:hypothetical protein Pelo_5810 [Pelomyxa schiedti]|nr:hypothetical protein Pelo_5810 [Pelomyxa schiedti]